MAMCKLSQDIIIYFPNSINGGTVVMRRSVGENFAVILSIWHDHRNVVAVLQRNEYTFYMTRIY